MGKNLQEHIKSIMIVIIKKYMLIDNNYDCQ